MTTETITLSPGALAMLLDTGRHIDAPVLTELTTTGGDYIVNELVGCNVLVRTVTMTLTGRLVACDRHTLKLNDAAWIADTGRYADALATGKLSEVEPYPGTAYIARTSIVDFCEWGHDLPRVQQ